MKDSKDVIREFNECVNMTAKELEDWLKSDDSNSAGWPKDGDGESVGHDSGRKIVEILKENPKGEADKYTEDQVSHMRKVVSYCKRHLAQEKKSNDAKPAEEVKQTKSYASLKNWGHDALKARGEQDVPKKGEQGSKKANAKKSGKKPEHDGNGEEKAGEKRKAGGRETRSSNKKRETAKGEAANDENQNKKEDDREDDGEEEKSSENQQEQNGNDANGSKGPEKGETVSWSWGSGNPEGKVLDVKPEKTTIKTKRGNEVTRKGKPDDPAVVLDTGKSKAIKYNHELN